MTSPQGLNADSFQPKYYSFAAPEKRSLGGLTTWGDLMAGAPFDWAEYLRLATTLSQNPDEASHWTSSSRAYYSVFHAASTRAIRNGYPAGQNSHEGIWKVFAKDANKDARRLAQWENTMKHVRVLADYKSVVPKISDRMAQQLIYARDFLTLLAIIPPSSPTP